MIDKYESNFNATDSTIISGIRAECVVSTNRFGTAVLKVAPSKMNATPSIKINQQQAIAHLSALGYKHNDKVYLRFFYPSGDNRQDRNGGVNLEGRYPDLPWGRIEQLQAQGRGCYVVVNPGGHKDSDIKVGRTVFYEHDNLDKELQHNLWQQIGLPEPTCQVDTGGKSIHSYWTLSSPCSVQQWRELQADLLEHSDGDRVLKNPSRVMRLAGAYHIKIGREPIRSELILNTSKTYSYEELRVIVPKQQKQESEATLRWDESNFQLNGTK